MLNLLSVYCVLTHISVCNVSIVLMDDIWHLNSGRILYIYISIYIYIYIYIDIYR